MRQRPMCNVVFELHEMFFFFQAEDGIRDLTVTGVQTCALPISYTVGLHQPMHYKVHYAPWENGRLWLGSAFIRVPDDKGGYSGEYGTVSAIDLNTGKVAWQQKTELPMMGGATATAGGLVLTGEGNGWVKAV